MRRKSTVSFADLIENVRQGHIDIAGFQRMFVISNPQWAADLLESLTRDPPIEIGPLMFWAPADSDAPTRGRYQTHTQARDWLIDGQKRLTALCAALGERPPWWPAERWDAVGGAALESGLVIYSRERMHFRPMKDARKHPQVALRLLLQAHHDGTVRQELTDAGVPNPADCVQPVTQIIDRLLHRDILQGWILGNRDDAFKAFCLRNGRAYSSLLPQAQMELSLLTLLEDTVVDHVDALQQDAAQAGMTKVFTVKALNEMLQRQLPANSRRSSASHAPAQAIARATTAVDQGARLFLQYLRHRGLVGKEYVVQPAAWQVLCHLFIRHPTAAQEDFAAHWLAQAIAQELYAGNPQAAQHHISLLHRADDYPAARHILHRLTAPQHIGTWDPDLLVRPAPGNGFGPAAPLYAMAHAALLNGTVSDLVSPQTTFPATAMRLITLWPEHHRSFASYFLGTQHTADALHRHGGWCRQAVDELGCTAEALAAQFLPEPPRLGPAPPSDAQLKARAGHIAGLLTQLLNASTQ